jgi:Cu+-exporting ATPase
MAAIDETITQGAARLPAGAVRVEPYAPIGRSGTVEDGRSEVDEAAVTGEVVPVLKQPGDRVLAGSRNGAGLLVVKPQQDNPRTPAETDLAVTNPDPIGPFLSVTCRRIASIDLAVLASTAVWFGLHPEYASVDGVALIVLGLISPGLLLVWPLQKWTLRAWLKRHRLHCPRLDRLHDLLAVRRIIFGRRGTLSQGALRVVSLQPGPNVAPPELVVQTLSAYQNVEDSWGRALMAFGISHRVHLKAVEKLEIEAGAGITASVADKRVVIGKPEWLVRHGIEIAGLDEAVAEYRRLGRELLFAGLAQPEPRFLGVFALADPPRAGTSALIRTCKQSGLETVMVGDSADTATATLAGLTGVGALVAEQESGKFDDLSTLVVARASDADLLQRYDNAVALGQPALEAMPQLPFGIGRDDTRHVLDFIVLAQMAARRLPLSFLLVWLTGWPLIAEGLGLIGLTPLLRLACLGLGVIIAVVQPQLLRLVDSLANDEHED